MTQTQSAERPLPPTEGAPPIRADGPATGSSARNGRPVRRGWFGRNYIIPLAVAAAAYLLYQLPPYLTLDPSRTHIASQFPLHYAILAAHVLTGGVTMVTLVLQLWPWLRRNHPAVHRWSGLLYVFGGALPSALLALVLFPFAFKPGSVAVLMSGILWAVTSVVGWVRARQGRYAEHRRWMLYSFAIVWGQTVWGFVIGMALFSLPVAVDVTYVSEAARWVGWVGNLLLVHWWIERTGRRGQDRMYGGRRSRSPEPAG
ncbi:DUF2306 domain-containing protein [Streptomyces spongiicola]|uniref:DUF2306 domain-containing protein n=1 Tax=Streptomyces spongiicola TaxID=1690221 RepID=UPI001C2C6598|nr:DUF2306 domain-containing protein [Streptomyces spongiicola]